MRISFTKILILVTIITVSIVIARINNIIQVDPLNTSKYNEQRDIVKEDITIDDSPNHLLWFIQISDLHISIFYDEDRVTELKEFCEKTVSAIRPAVVLASGDLTDAKTFDSLGSKQYEEEWKLYKNVLDECKVSEKTVWLDVRGNHDNFNVPNIDSKENYFRNYSVQGKRYPRSYLYQVHGPGEDLYSFIALDACLEPGPRRPFNFIGVLAKPEVENVKRLIREVENLESNYTIWFGHYPTSCILAPDDGVRSLIGRHKQGLAYLCGHLHTLLGIAPTMYTLQKDGFLELELADWKDNRKYRIMAIDHGLLSFVDVDHGKWPVAMVTNPKHALFAIPDREPMERMVESTHIRVLAFSLSEITNVSVKLDDGSWQYCRHIQGPLYVAKWNPQEYAEGIHHIHPVPNKLMETVWKRYSILMKGADKQTVGNQPNQTAQQEVTKYLSEPLAKPDVNVGSFWKNERLTYPSLSSLAFKYLSATVFFETSGIICDKKINRLDPEKVQMLVFLNRNLKYNP